MAFPVISPYYCAPYTINLQINTKTGVTYDSNNNAIFSIKHTLFTLHHRRLLCDARGNPVVTLYKKTRSLHGRWQVFRGKTKSNNTSELLFSVKRSSMTQFHEIKVFLTNNENESVCDFRVNVSSGKCSCTVYAGESPTIVATMVNNGGFNVLIEPNVDHAFIVALLVIIDEMKDYRASMNLVVDMAKIPVAVVGLGN